MLFAVAAKLLHLLHWIVVHFLYMCSQQWGDVFTIEELNDVGEVHVVLQDDVSVHLHQRQGDEEDKVTRGDMLGCPDGFPDCEHVIIHQLWSAKRKNKWSCISYSHSFLLPELTYVFVFIRFLVSSTRRFVAICLPLIIPYRTICFFAHTRQSIRPQDRPTIKHWAHISSDAHLMRWYLIFFSVPIYRPCCRTCPQFVVTLSVLLH